MPGRRGVSVDAGCCLALVLVSVLAHWQLVSGQQIIADYDAFVYFYPNREYTAARLLAGELPLWNPYLFGGTPHLANPQSAVFYPGTWLFFLLVTPQAYSLNLILHAALAGVAMYLLLRKGLDAPPASGLVAGLCFMLSGPIVAQGGHLNQLSAAALLPLIALAIERALRKQTVGSIVLGGVLLGLQILAGHPQVVYMTLAVGSLLTLWRISGSAPASWIGQMVSLGMTIAVGLGLAAVQLLPTLEVTRQGIRSGGLFIGEAAASSLPPELLPLALLPGYSENPPSTEFFGFIGAIGLTLAVIGVLNGLTRRDGWLIVTAAFGLLLALGSNTAVFETLFGRVPGFDSFRVPARWLLVWAFSTSVLAGLSLRSLARPTAPRVTATALAVFGIWAWLLLPQIIPGDSLLWPVPRATLLVWVALAAVVITLWALRGRALSAPRLAAILVTAMSGELLIARLELPFSKVVPLDAWAPASTQTEQLRGLDPRFRMLSIASDWFEPDEMAELRARYADLTENSFTQLVTALKWWQVEAPNLPAVQRIASIDGYDGGVLPMSRFVLVSSLLDPVGDVRPDGVLITSLDTIPRPAALDLFGVKLVLASSDQALPTDLSHAGSVSIYGETFVYDRADALERAYLTHAAVERDDDAAIVEMFESGWSPRDATILSAPLTRPLDAAIRAETVTLVSSSPERVALRTEVSSNALLVLSDPWYPGWHAEVNGQRVPLHRANIHFRAIELSPGLHEVQFVYDAAMLKIGALISATTVMLTVGAWLFSRRRRSAE